MAFVAQFRATRHFNPPAPCGAGPPQMSHRSPADTFQSTRPVWGGTCCRARWAIGFTFQSTRPVRGGTVRFPSAGRAADISIHPPRAGRDRTDELDLASMGISIHPPRAGRDHNRMIRRFFSKDFNPPAPCGAGLLSWDEAIGSRIFQSTRPVRGGTAQRNVGKLTKRNFNPPAPCGAGPKGTHWPGCHN